MKKTAIIVDDERLARNELKKMLTDYPEIEVIGEAGNVDEALKSIEELGPDILFLDIQMPAKTGFDLLAELDAVPTVIFTTAHDEYALKAFKLNSVDYLLKPIDEDELVVSISKFQNQFQKNAVTGLDFEAIKRMLVNPVQKEYKNRFSVKIGYQIKVVLIDEIECFYSENKGTYLHTIDNRDYLLDISLEQLETELSPESFYRISRKFIIPLQSIKEIQMHTNSRLKIILPTYKEDEVIVARERVSDFKTWIG